ncbi:MAG: hypothetical protein QOE57_3362 [Acidimicrobiaceae bacterium]|nr:hypothetical protein [Acidimicrobiaceae bacterium]
MDYMVARARRLASDVAGGDHRIKAEDGYDPRCPRWCRRLASVQYVRSGMVRGSWELDRAWRWRRARCGPCSATQMLLPSSLCRGAAVIGITKLAPRMRARETGRSPPSSTGPPAAVPEWLRRFDVHAEGLRVISPTGRIASMRRGRVTPRVAPHWSRRPHGHAQTHRWRGTTLTNASPFAARFSAAATAARSRPDHVQGCDDGIIGRRAHSTSPVIACRDRSTNRP